MAATGNMSLIKEMGQVMLREARALSNYASDNHMGPFGRGAGLFYWSPTMNLGRDPRWGRFQESVSEDPWLNGEYSASLLQGFQGNDQKYLAVAATCKHFVAYSLEAADGFTRHTFDAMVSPQDLVESYLPAFKACVTKGKPAQVMCSYNSLNGVPSCLRGDLLHDTLRQRWGHKGLVVSDQDSIHDAWATHRYGNSFRNVTAIAIQAGCDQNDGVTYADNAEDAVKAGLLKEADIDTALKRILLQRFRVGAFDRKEEVPYRAIPATVLDSPPHRASALQAARESIVLLENANQTLPLHKSARIAVIGPMANNTVVMKGGKADYHPSFSISILDGLRQLSLGRVGFAAGSPVSGNTTHKEMAEAKRLAAQADVTIVCVGIDATIEHEGTDRTSIGLPGAQLGLLKAVSAVSRSVVVVLVNGGPVSVDWLKQAISTRTVHAVVEAFDGGQSAGQAVAEVIYGDVNPSGVLPFTLYPEQYVDQVRMSNMSLRPGLGNPGRTYRFYSGTPLWPFGAGRSYTKFLVSWSQTPTVSSPRAIPTAQADALKWSILVKNTGDRAGSKVIMGFLGRDPADLQDGEVVPRPSLWALRKVWLNPGEETRLVFESSGDGWCPFCTVDREGFRAVRSGLYVVRFGGDGSAGGGGCARDGTCVTSKVHLTGPTLPRPL